MIQEFSMRYTGTIAEDAQRLEAAIEEFFELNTHEQHLKGTIIEGVGPDYRIIRVDGSPRLHPQEIHHVHMEDLGYLLAGLETELRDLYKQCHFEDMKPKVTPRFEALNFYKPLFLDNSYE